MSQASFFEFLHMGGYAEYVWSAYGLAMMVMVLMTLHAVLKSSRVWRKLKFEHDLQTRKGRKQ